MDVNLSKAVRSNLLSLQNTATMMAKTQERLATGLKVNSALDNPTNFFTASGLKSRAGDLGQLMDSVSNAIQTLAAADKGITAITKLVESAQATARQALQTTATTAAGGGDAVDGGDDEGPTTAVATGTQGFAGVSTYTGDVDLSAFDFSDLDDETFTITIGDTEATFTIAAADPEDGSIWIDSAGSAQDFADALNDVFGEDVFTIDGDDFIQIDATADITISAGAVAEQIFGAADDTTAIEAAAAFDLGAALTGELAFSVGEESFSIDLDGLDDLADVVAALNDDEDFAAVATASITFNEDGEGVLTITATNEGEDITFDTDGDSGDIVTALGLADATAPADGDGDGDTGGGDTGPLTKRQELVNQYNELLGQINDLARDAGFNGVNLINGDNLQVIFNEDSSSKLDITGVTFNAEGLGLSELDTNAFNTNAGINETLADLKSGIETLRTQASKFGSNLSVVETRQNFTKDMINVLETGAANLTLADTNEEAANLLALQTRQQLSSTALSMASQADQAVLRLF